MQCFDQNLSLYQDLLLKVYYFGYHQLYWKYNCFLWSLKIFDAQHYFNYVDFWIECWIALFQYLLLNYFHLDLYFQLFHPLWTYFLETTFVILLFDLLCFPSCVLLLKIVLFSISFGLDMFWNFGLWNKLWCKFVGFTVAI